MKLHLTIFDPCAGGAVVSEEAFDVVSIDEPFTAPGLFGTDAPFRTVFYKDSAGEIAYKYFKEGEDKVNIYTNNLIKQYKLIIKY